MIWESLSKLALLGTGRGFLDQNLQADFQEKGIDLTMPLPKIVLEAAALYQPMRKAGFPLLTFSNPSVSPIPLGEEQSCSPRSTHHLRLILNGTYAPALAEFTFHLQQNKKIFPPENLPDLFQECLTDFELWQKIKPVIGKRGVWLLQQNPNWNPLWSNVKAYNWETGSRAERTAILSEERKHSPDKALVLLEKNWSQEDPRHKQALLKILAVNLSKKDEPFLEKCLDDRRKEIRQVAASLLVKIGDSLLVDRLFKELTQYVSFDQRKGITIQLPEALSKAAQRDGILPKAKNAFTGGMKAGWLLQIVACIPPHRWEDFFQKKPTAILEHIAKSDWNTLLINGILEACLIHEAPDWTVALVAHWQKRGEQNFWQQPNGKKLLLKLSSDAFNQIALSQLNKKGLLLEEESLAFQLISLDYHQWSDRLTMLTIKGLQNWIADNNSFSWDTVHYQKILKIGAYRSNPALFDQLKTGWNYQSKVWPKWEKEVELFFRTLRFRKEMIKELTVKEQPFTD